MMPVNLGRPNQETFPQFSSMNLTSVQGYSYDQRLEYVDMDFNVPHTPIVGLGQ